MCTQKNDKLKTSKQQSLQVLFALFRKRNIFHLRRARGLDDLDTLLNVVANYGHQGRPALLLHGDTDVPVVVGQDARLLTETAVEIPSDPGDG